MKSILHKFSGVTGFIFCVILHHKWIQIVAQTSTQIPITGIALTPTESIKEVTIPNGQSITLTTSGIPDGSGFSLIQAHSVLRNITISYIQTPTSGQSVTGFSVGLVINGSVATTVYLLNENAEDVKVLVSLMVYGADAPIPGGCNMELPIKTAPYLPTRFTGNLLTVEYPLGSWPLNVRPATCDRAPLQYDIYILYLPERDFSDKTAFDSLRLMSNVTSIEIHGSKVEFNGIPPSKVKFANYGGTGRIIAVVLRTLTVSAAYVPTLSYGCEPASDDADALCDVLGSTGAKLLSAWLIFAGLFLVSLGHRYYKCQLFLFGFLISAVIFYVILLLFISVGNTVAGTTATVVGAVGGAAWVTIWAKCGTPIGPVFLATFIMGLLFASIMAFTPLADFAVMKDDITFWLSFFCLVLVIPLLIVSFNKMTSILVSSVVGAYAVIVPLDNYIGSNLKFIFLNVLRRATDRDFNTAIIHPPFQTQDLILTFVWGVLALGGFLFQVWRERDRAPFPPAPGPWNWPSRERLRHNDNPDETSPLLPGR